MNNEIKSKMQKALHWMMELEDTWNDCNNDYSADYNQLIEDIEELQELLEDQ